MSADWLRVRVAEATGHGLIRPCLVLDSGEVYSWHFSPGSGKSYRAGFSWLWEKLFNYGEWHLCEHEQNWLPPYGENSPEGWRFTGPLVELYGLCWTVNMGEWCVYDAAVGDDQVGGFNNPCEAIAEWVARYGALAGVYAPPREGDGA